MKSYVDTKNDFTVKYLYYLCVNQCKQWKSLDLVFHIAMAFNFHVDFYYSHKSLSSNRTEIFLSFMYSAKWILIFHFILFIFFKSSLSPPNNNMAGAIRRSCVAQKHTTSQVRHSFRLWVVFLCSQVYNRTWFPNEIS